MASHLHHLQLMHQCLNMLFLLESIRGKVTVDISNVTCMSYSCKEKNTNTYASNRTYFIP